jgi:hypothetical protein
MVFLIRAAFWTAVVALYVPGASSGIDDAAGLQALERFKADAIQRLARVRADLNAGNMRAP